MPESVKYSILIPVFNSTDSLFSLIERIGKVFSTEVNDSFEVILVDDGSWNPECWPVIQKIVNEYSNVRAIQLMRNFGKNGALLCGFEEVRGDYVITMDDDLQHSPEDIPKLISKRNHDIVIGNFKTLKVSFEKKMTSYINAKLEGWLIDKPKHIRSSPFRMIKREVTDAMLKIKTPHPSIPALMYFVTRDVVNVDVSHEERKFGKTGFTWKKMGSSLSNLVINNSSFLLKAIATIGIVISFLSFGMGVYFTIKKLTVGTQILGWASTIVTILFIGGLILFSIGVLGEYLIRIINGVEGKPSFIIRKKIG